MKFSSILRRDPEPPSLKERAASLKAGLAATREKYARTLRVHRALNDPLPPKPEPVDRVALVNYATWLFMERRLVCDELYPHMGGRGESFVLANCAADRFHFPGNPNGFPLAKASPSRPSTRAVQVLDMVGVDWRADLTDSGRLHLDHPRMQDTGERPDTPHGWPRLDGALLTALVDLRRVDAAIEVLIAHLPADRDTETLPGYGELQDARAAVLDILTETRADSLPGLQAKARTLLVDSLRGDPDTVEALAHSIAKDLIGAAPGALAPKPDPIHAVLAESKRLEDESEALFAKGNDGNATPEQEDSVGRVEDHWCNVVLKTVPTTARGCAALARAAQQHCERWCISSEHYGAPALDLIARSPLL
ncbi:hypothetical protein Q8W71_30055 [Methylobacterium sp. NEAU 140]|uniref:hypothetical protein n=1 Tax=Methylobacterium sp. NEAU 140 TaxID=3064945 RepID=UPI002734CCF0|nr:hypothetical protein [Methylobacterium sp. NEAU 140]MDP4026845.1 hypothetical protein [Methylobacterium sp. NEAU 140]